MWKKLYLVQDIVLSVLKANCPIASGNLSKSINAHNEELYITIGDEDVDYAHYTNESWDIVRPSLAEKGYKNPNEGWIDRSLDIACPIIKQVLEGAITEEEAQEIVDQNNATYQARLDKKAEEKLEKMRTI